MRGRRHVFNFFIRWPQCSRVNSKPDLLVLIQDQWFMLECKQHANSPVQPNQGYYNDLFGEMSFCRFVYPENESEVLDEIQRSLRP